MKDDYRNLQIDLEIDNEVLSRARAKPLNLSKEEVGLVGKILGDNEVPIDIKIGKEILGKNFNEFFQNYCYPESGYSSNCGFYSLTNISLKHVPFPFFSVTPNKYFKEFGYEPKKALGLGEIFPSAKELNSYFIDPKKAMGINRDVFVEGKPTKIEENLQGEIKVKSDKFKKKDLEYDLLIKTDKRKKFLGKEINFSLKKGSHSDKFYEQISFYDAGKLDFEIINLKDKKITGKAKNILINPYIKSGSKIKLKVPDVEIDDLEKISKEHEYIPKEILEKSHQIYLAISDWEKEAMLSRFYHYRSYSSNEKISVQKYSKELLKPFLGEEDIFLEKHWYLQPLWHAGIKLKKNFPYEIEFKLKIRKK